MKLVSQIQAHLQHSTNINMRQVPLILFAFFHFGCSSPAGNTQVLQARIDSLENKLEKTYKPGFGEFMSTIQAHHVKLWYAGINENWKLADFEVHEIMEAIEAIQEFQKERKETQLIGMINPAVANINDAIQQKDTSAFKSSYSLLTSTCNNCHRAAGFAFNVVQIPDNQPFSNQVFKVSSPK
jgi:hypothetical protein